MATPYFFGKELCLSYGWECLKQLKVTVYTAVLVGKFDFFFCMDLVSKEDWIKNHAFGDNSENKDEWNQFGSLF